MIRYTAGSSGVEDLIKGDMQFAVLASGSKANCTVVQSAAGNFLIDCGLSARETVRRLEGVGVDPSSLFGVFLTHEHRDHTAGIRVFCKKFKIPVYANAGTAAALDAFGTLDGLSTQIFKTGYALNFGELSIQPFAISHDAAEPVGFDVRYNHSKLVYVTDLGKVTTLVRSVCQDCNALILEFNHDEKLLWGCDYPWNLKQRIASNHGHLSNANAVALVSEVFHEGLKHLVLGHISENSNTHATVRSALAAEIDLSLLETCLCASPYHPTALITVSGDERVLSLAASL